jgi:hypothetical protein
MASLAKMANAGNQRKPTVRAIMTTGKDGVHIHIPGVVSVDDIREKENAEKGTTSFTVVALTYTPEGKVAEPVILEVKDGDRTSKANFAISTINLMFRGMVEEVKKV